MATSPKRRWRTRLFRVSIVSAALLSSSVLVLRSTVFAEWAADSLALFLEAQTGESFVIGSLDIDPLRGRVALDGVVISHPGAPPGQGTIAAIEQIEARASLRGGWPHLDTVTVDRPSVRLHVDPDGLREFRALTGSSGSGRQPAAAFPWDQLRIRDASLSVDAPNDTAVRVFGITIEEIDGTAQITLGGAEIVTPQLTQNVQPVTVSGILASPRQLLVPDARLQSEAVVLSGAVMLQPGGSIQGLLEATVDLPGLSPLMPAPQALAGTAFVEAELSGPLKQPHIEGALVAHNAAIVRPDRAISLGEEVAAGWRLEGRQLHLEPIIAHWAEGLVEVRASIDLRSTGFYAAISGEGLSAEAAMRLAGVAEQPWVGMETDLELQLAGVLQPLTAAGSLSLAGAKLAVAGGPVSDPAQEHLLDIPQLWLDAELDITREDVTFLARDAHFGRSRGTVSAQLDYGPQPEDNHLVLNADFAPIDLRDVRPMADLALTGRGPASVSVRGPLSGLVVDAAVNLSGFGFAGMVLADGVQGRVRSPDLRSLVLPDFQARLGDSAYTGQLTMRLDTPVPEVDLQVLVGEGRLSDLIGVSVDLDGVDGDVSGVLSLQGPVDAMDGEIRLAAQEAELYGEHFTDGEALAWMEDGRFTLERLELRREREGRVESLFARGSVGRGYATNVEVISSGIRLESMDTMAGGPAVRGELSLDVSLGGTLQSLEPSGRLALRRARVGQRTVDPSTVMFGTEDGTLRFEGNIAEDKGQGTGMKVAGSLDLWDHQGYKVSAEMKDFPLSTFYAEAPDGSPISAMVTGALRLEGDLQESAPKVLDASISSAEVLWRNHALRSEEPWRYAQEGRQFSLEGLSLVDDLGATRLRFGGTGQARGEMLMAGDGVVDLDLLRMVVPGLQRAEGLASVNLSIVRSAPGEDVETTADIVVSNALVRGTWFPHPVEEMAVKITATPDGYTLRGGQGRVGGGPLSFRGQIDAEAWMPTRYDVRGSLLDARVRYLDFLPTMTGDAALSVNGPADDLLLAGTVTVDEMVFSKRIDWESWILEVSGERLRDAVAEETADLFTMDVRIGAKDTIRMRNNVADLTAGGALHLMGTTARPGMTGTIRAQPGGFVYLKERNFELQRAELTFIDPYSFDPEVDIAMVTDVSAREQDVEIEYLVRGQYSDWYAETRSDPPMSPADINALLLFGLTLEELERYGGLSSALVVEGGDLLASKFGIVEQVGEGIFQYELLRLDRVDLISGVSERSYSAVTSELRLLAEKDLEWGGTLRLEQNLNRVSDSYVSLEQKLARKLYLRGYYATEQQDRYISIGGAYGLDFNVRWELD